MNDGRWQLDRLDQMKRQLPEGGLSSRLAVAARRCALLTALLVLPLNAQDQPSAPVPGPPPLFHYGGFADFAYLLDFNHPANQLFRDRGTSFRVDEPDLNMAAAYIRKDPSDTSRWGLQLTIQGGKDSEAFGFSATAPNLDGSRWLRHLGQANVSYLAPVGKGLTVQGGIFG